MDKIAVVAINGTMREFDKQYHYLVPEDLSENLLPGMRVIVPFGNGNSLKEGYDLGFAGNSDYSRMKNIKKIIDKKPVLTASQIELAGWMKQRYFCTYASAIKCMLPAGIDVKTLKIVRLTGAGGVRNTAGPAEHASGEEGSGSAPVTTLKLSPSQKAIISVLESSDGLIEIEELKKLSNVKTAFSKHISALEKEGVIRIDEQYSAAVKEKSVRVAGLAMSREEVEEDMQNGVIKRIQQIRILEMLLENEYIAVADLARFASVSTSVIDTLRKNNYIYYRDIEVKRDPLKHREVEHTSPMKPTHVRQVYMNSFGFIFNNVFPCIINSAHPFRRTASPHIVNNIFALIRDLTEM
jgi:primosomal protein N' (replication factor Y)